MLLRGVVRDASNGVEDDGRATVPPGPPGAERYDPAMPQYAADLDASDPLAPFRDRFVVDDPDLVYLDGNSLGRAPRRAVERVAAVAAGEWGGELVRAWDHWIDLPLRIGDALAAGVLGAAPGSVTIADSTTVNLFRVASAALDDRPDRRVIVADRAEFPTDRYVLQGLAAARGLEIRWLDGDPSEGLAAEAVIEALDADVALVLLSLVSYRSSAIMDIDAVEAAARSAGAHTLWDLSHAGGAIPVEPRRPRHRPRRRLHLQVPVRRPRRARLPLRRAAAAGPAPAAGPGLVRAARPVRLRPGVRARPGHARLAGRHAADPRADRDRGGRPGRGRGRDRRHPREVRGAHGLRGGAARRRPRAAGLHARQPEGPARGAARTSGSATRMRARSPTASGSAA